MSISAARIENDEPPRGRRCVRRGLAPVALALAAWSFAGDAHAALPSGKPHDPPWWEPATWYGANEQEDETPAPSPSASAVPVPNEPPRPPSSVAASNARGMAGLMVAVGLVLAAVAWVRHRARPEAQFLADLRAPVGKVILGHTIDSEVERDADTVVFRATHVVSGAARRVCLVRPEHVGDRGRAQAHDERARTWALASPPGRRVREVLREQGEVVIVLEA